MKKFFLGQKTAIKEHTLISLSLLMSIAFLVGLNLLVPLMKIYSSHGINDFIVCCGYKG
jgi:glucose-1-phosphate cytidylyltransferase